MSSPFLTFLRSIVSEWESMGTFEVVSVSRLENVRNRERGESDALILPKFRKTAFTELNDEGY